MSGELRTVIGEDAELVELVRGAELNEEKVTYGVYYGEDETVDTRVVTVGDFDDEEQDWLCTTLSEKPISKWINVDELVLTECSLITQAPYSKEVEGVQVEVPVGSVIALEYENRKQFKGKHGSKSPFNIVTLKGKDLGRIYL